jgi:hypothetical protein
MSRRSLCLAALALGLWGCGSDAHDDAPVVASGEVLAQAPPNAVGADVERAYGSIKTHPHPMYGPKAVPPPDPEPVPDPAEPTPLPGYEPPKASATADPKPPASADPQKPPASADPHAKPPHPTHPKGTDL